MGKKQAKKLKNTYPPNAHDHATQIEQEFFAFDEYLTKHRGDFTQWTKTTKKDLSIAVGSAVYKSLSSGLIITRSTFMKDKKALKNLILAEIDSKICWEMATSLYEPMFLSLYTSFRQLMPKVRALASVSTQHNQNLNNVSLNVAAAREENDSLGSRVARLSVDNRVLGTSGENDDDARRAPKRVKRFHDSLEPSADKTEQHGGRRTDKKSEIKTRKNQDDEAPTIAPPDPAVFTISLSVPCAPKDHPFVILFNDERVARGLTFISASEIWQIVRDAIHHDADIPHRPSTNPWITHVRLQKDKCLAFGTSTREDLATVTTNVQWVRNVRDTVSAGIRSYKVVLKKLRVRRNDTKIHRDTPSIIDRLRLENSDSIPLINDIGALRDATKLLTPKRDKYVDYVLVFGSRDTANAALNMGLLYQNKKRTCVIHAPGEQWHKQCSRCQSHEHINQDCPSQLACGNCGSKHLTQYCTSSTTKCANCEGEHIATSKLCPKWLKAEKKAHRECRFPATEEEAKLDVSTRVKKSMTATLPPQALPSSAGSKPQNQPKRPRKTPKVTQTSARKANTPPAIIHPKATTPPTVIRRKKEPVTPPPATPSVLLRTIDEFRAFVAAREKPPKTNPRKRKADPQVAEYTMAGALQADGSEAKRIKTEDEGPVWPIGHRDYAPPSLKARR